MNLREKIANLISSDEPIPFEEGEHYYNRDAGQSFKVKTVGERYMTVVYSKSPIGEQEVDLELHTIKYNDGIIFKLGNERDKE
ncbi:MAG: hypothetical protein ABEH81_01370 [Halopenitus sp.]